MLSRRATDPLRFVLNDRATFAVGSILVSGIALLVLTNLVLNSLRHSADEWESLPARLYGTFHIGADGSIAENFNHGMAFGAALMFLAAGIGAKSRICIALATFMAIAWFDDSAQYHERMGQLLAAEFPALRHLGPNASTAGEMIAFLLIGLVCLTLAAWAMRTLEPQDRFVIRLVKWPILLLVASAALGDFIHSALLETRLEQLFLYLEDGGEMLAVALLATAALYLVRHLERQGEQG